LPAPTEWVPGGDGSGGADPLIFLASAPLWERWGQAAAARLVWERRGYGRRT